MLKVSGLAKTYDGVRYSPAPVSFDTNSERPMIFIDGPNGCGKTTLLKLLSGEEKPTTGTFRLGDQDALTLIYQRDGLLPEISGYSNLRMLGFQDSEIISTTSSLGLSSSVLHQKAKNLSGGEERRVQLARTLLSKRPLWLLDEPTSHADRTLKELVCHAIVNHLRNQGLVILVSHDPDLRATLTDQLGGICTPLVITLNSK